MTTHKKKRFALIVVLSLTCYCLATCGTLGGGIGDEIYFPTSKSKLEVAIDSLYSKNPEFRVPDNWKKFDTWSARGYNFLESRIFYFKSVPEEMYYVTFIGDSAVLADTTKVAIGISAINKGENKWLLGNDLDSREKKRIERRFNDEIVSKLKLFVVTKTTN